VEVRPYRKKPRYCKPAAGKNGKIKLDWVTVRGKEEHRPEGNFYLHRYDGNKEIWKEIGPNAQEAANAADFFECLQRPTASGRTEVTGIRIVGLLASSGP
jgi:hypothetical protein